MIIDFNQADIDDAGLLVDIYTLTSPKVGLILG